MCKNHITMVIVNTLFLALFAYTIYVDMTYQYFSNITIMSFLIKLFLIGLIGFIVSFYRQKQMILDRFMLAFYVHVIAFALFNYGILIILFLTMGPSEGIGFGWAAVEKFYPSLFAFLSKILDFYLKYFYGMSFDMPIRFYLILLSVGIYTTCATQAGFVGVIGKNTNAIKKTSWVLLCIALIIGLIALFCADTKKALWIGSVIFGIIYMFVKRHTITLESNKEKL